MSVQIPPTEDTSPPAPRVVVVMGVSGCGKSTVGALLALHLRWEFEDADWFHPACNVDKMHSGIPLTDEDRWPWLNAVAAWIDKTRCSGGHGVIACSALKRRYRDVLIGIRADVRLVYLKGDETLIARRVATRHERLHAPSLLHSQFEALEEPGPDERSRHRLDRATTARDRRANLVSAEHGRTRSAAQANISEIIRPWRVDEARKELPMPTALSSDLLENMPATLSLDPPEDMPATLSPDLLEKMDAYWRAANYLSVGQIYLQDNPLLETPLKIEHIKPRLLGHWGTTTGINFIYVHLNRLIKQHDLNMIYVIGPGHGGPGLVAHSYLEGSYTERYPSDRAQTEMDCNGSFGSSPGLMEFPVTYRRKLPGRSMKAENWVIPWSTPMARHSTIQI